MSKIKGVVEKMYQNTTRNGKPYWNIKVDNERYGGIWEQPNYDEGDTIEFAFTMKGQYRNIDGKVAVISKGSGKTDTSKATPVHNKPGNQNMYSKYFTNKWEVKPQVYPIATDDPQNAIINQNALTNASKLYEMDYADATPKKREGILKDILKTAELMAEFSSGRLTAIAPEEDEKDDTPDDVPF